MENIELFERFNASVDLAGLKEDIENAEKPMEKLKIPAGDYEVAIVKLELGENTYKESPSCGCPQVNVWFKIVNGDYKGQRIFWSTNLYGQYMGLQIKKMNDFLETLDSGVDVHFEDFVQYANMLAAIFEAIDGHYEYHLVYGEETSKGGKTFKTYNILEKYNKA